MGKEKESDWKQVYTGSGAHLERVMEMYKELDYETKLEPVSLKEAEECLECFEANEAVYRLYVKEKTSGSQTSSFK